MKKSMMVFGLLAAVSAHAQNDGVCPRLIQIAESKVQNEAPVSKVSVEGDWAEAARLLQLQLDELSNDKKFMLLLYKRLRSVDPDIHAVSDLMSIEEDRAETYAATRSWADCGDQASATRSKTWVKITANVEILGRFGCVKKGTEQLYFTEMKHDFYSDLLVSPDKGVVITYPSPEGTTITTCTVNAPKSGCVTYPLRQLRHADVTGRNAAEFRLKTVYERIQDNQAYLIEGVRKELAGSGCEYPLPAPGEKSKSAEHASASSGLPAVGSKGTGILAGGGKAGDISVSALP